MLQSFGSASKCLYCIWPGVIIAIGWYLSKIIDGKTYYGALPVGVDPLSPQGQAEFEITRQKDKEKRRLIYWCIGIIACGYIGYFSFHYFTSGVKAASIPEVIPTATETITNTETFQPTNIQENTTTPVVTNTPGVTNTYNPTATNRIVYQQITIIYKQTIIHTQIVTMEVTRLVMVTSTPTYTPTFTPTYTETFTQTLTETLSGQ
jgi:hypothetical protein